MPKYELKEAEVRLILKEGESIYSRKPIESAEDAVELIKDQLSYTDREYCMSINLNSKLKPINYSTIAIGGMTATSFSVSDIFKTAMLSGADGVIFFHSHPSGDPSPSIRDIDVTKSICEAGRILGIKVIDHIIVGTGSGLFYSFKENFPELFFNGFSN